MKKVLSVFMFVAMIAVVLGAAIESSAAPAQDDSPQELSFFILATVTGLDVGDARTTTDTQVLSHAQEGLARFRAREDGSTYIQPAGATHWDVSEDGLTWTFHLREYYWSDGVRVTAQQFVDSIKRLVNPDNAFANANEAHDIKNAFKIFKGEASLDELGVTAVDDSTLVIELEVPTPYFENRLASVNMCPIRLDLLEQHGETYQNDPSVHAFCGPFIITEYIPLNSVTLAKNPAFWNAANIKLEKVTMHIVEEYQTKVQLFNSREVDVIDGYGDYIEPMNARAADGAYRYFSGLDPSLWWLCFEQKNGGLSGLMKSVKVRQALSYALNRDEFADLVFGRHIGAYGLIPYGVQSGSEEDYRAVYPEPLREVEGMTDEQLQALFLEGMRELGDNRELSDVTLLFNGRDVTPEWNATYEYFQQTWQNRLGITIEMKVFGDRSLYTEATRVNKQYDIGSIGMWAGTLNDPNSWIDMWATSSSWHEYFGEYSSQRYDDLFAQLSGEMDYTKRNKIYAELERMVILEDAGLCPTYYMDSIYYVHNYVQGLEIPNFGPEFVFYDAYITGK